MKKKGARREGHTSSPAGAERTVAHAVQRDEPATPDGEALESTHVEAREEASVEALSTSSNGDEREAPSVSARPSPHASFWDGRVVAFVLGVKTLVLLFAAQAYTIAKNERPGSFHEWLSIWNRWDAPHYLDLARMGYVKDGIEARWIVFYPLYPWLVRAASIFVRDEPAGALLISTLASVAAGLLLYRLARLDEDEWVARGAVFFMFVFPTSYFLHIGYTESLFLTLALGTMLAARTRRWPLAGLLGVLACMTRVNGLALVPALVFEAWEEYYASGRRVRAEWLWALLPAAGFGVYLLINWRVQGHPFAFLQMQGEYWYRTFAWPWDGMAGSWRMIWSGTPSDALMVGWQEFFFVMLGLALTAWAWLYMRASYAAWMICNCLLWTCTKFVLSVPRYTLVLFPAYIIFARASARRPVAGALIAVWSLLFLALFLMRFSQGYWAF
jgi:Gpi18-like mannosyltransferase